ISIAATSGRRRTCRCCRRASGPSSPGRWPTCRSHAGLRAASSSRSSPSACIEIYVIHTNPKRQRGRPSLALRVSINGLLTVVKPQASSGNTMLSPFFILAAQSPSRQQAFRTLVVVHLSLLLAGAWVVGVSDPLRTAPYLGHLLLIAGIVEG